MGIRENVFVDPRIGGTNRTVGPDCGEKEEIPWAQRAVSDFKKSPVILIADVLEHAQRSNAVEGSFHVSVILQADIDRQPFAPLPSPLHLLSRKGYPTTL